MFLYAGQRLLLGDAPYVDLWDHKGPIIYYVNALGLLAGGGSPVGVVALEYVSLGAAALAGYLLLRRSFGRAAALVASVVWLFGAVRTLGDGNFTEEYALPVQFLVLYLAADGLHDDRRRQTVRWLAIGALGAVLFMLKPSLVGVVIAAGLFRLLLGVASREWRTTVAALAALVAGLLATLLLVVAGLAARGALASAYDQVVVYNALYSRAARLGLGEIEPLIDWTVRASTRFLPSQTLYLAGLGWFISAGISAGSLWDSWSGKLPVRPVHALILIALIDAPVDFLFVALPGRGYEHYFLAWLPAIAVLAACVPAVVGHAASAWVAGGRAKGSLSVAAALIVGGIVLLPVPEPLTRIPERLTGLPHLRQQLVNSEAAREISALSMPDDFVLVWGAETALNFQSNRRSPTRYVYQYPLYTPGYGRSEMAAELLRDLRERQPRLILDTSETNISIPPLDGPSREAWQRERAPRSEFRSVVSPGMDEVFRHIQGHYRLERTFGNNWKIYRLTVEIIPAKQARPAVELDYRLGPELALRGYDLSRDRAQSGETLSLTLYWEPLAVPRADYSVFVHLAGADDRPIAQSDGYPLRGRYPTSLWRPGEIVRDTITLTIPSSAAKDYRLLVGMYDLRTMARLPITSAAGSGGDRIEIEVVEGAR